MMKRGRDRVLRLLFCVVAICIITAACVRKTTDVSDLGDDSIRLDESADKFSANNTGLDDSITGLYVENKEHGNGNGLEITALGDDEYTVQLVQVDDFKVIERAEFQSAYVRKKMEEQTFYFHWYTGVPDKIESKNKFHDIVVYHVTVDHEKLAGYYHYISPNQLQGYEKTDIIFYKIEN